MKVNVLETEKGTYIMEIMEDLQPIAIFDMQSVAEPVKKIKKAILILKTDPEAWKMWEGIIDPIAWKKWDKYLKNEDKTLLALWMKLNFENHRVYEEYIKPTINELIRESGTSQLEFAYHFNIPIKKVHKWCQGRAKCPAYILEMIHKILKYENIMEDYRGISEFKPEN